MAGSVNKVILIGNLGRDPEAKHFDNGGSLARFPIATSDSYTNKAGEKIENTDWHNIVVRGGLVDVVMKYLKKGDKVYIEGRLRTRNYEDNGVTKYVTEVITQEMTMLTPRNSNEGGSAPTGGSNPSPAQASPAKPQNPSAEGGQEDDDLPF